MIKGIRKVHPLKRFAECHYGGGSLVSTEASPSFCGKTRSLIYDHNDEINRITRRAI